ncbi:MAG: hypothetical protein M3083_18635 [Actinomycetota bacterium]|nr:hypothetical protein [Actinomycetota bacterium]
MAKLEGDNGLIVEVTKRGPDATELAVLSSAVLAHPAVAEQLRGTEHRMLSLLPVEIHPEPKIPGVTAAIHPEPKLTATPPPAEFFQALIYDYTNNRTVTARGRLADLSDVAVSHSAQHPHVTAAEFQAAGALLLADPEIGPAIQRGEIRLYRAMPPLSLIEQPDGRHHRGIPVGIEVLSPGPGQDRHRSVVVDMVAHRVIHNPAGVFSGCAKQCGSPEGTCTYDGGTGGEVHLTVSDSGTKIWDLVVLRPSASSGTNGSGIELRYVDYRATRVLYRAHVPILNVEYPNPECNCGPTFRDQNNEENGFHATGTDVIPGFRLCTSPATTIVDNGVDGGNFHGVAIWIEGDEVVLESVTSAGWYRYASQWRLGRDGTIRPRYGFAAISNACTCLIHHHHVYWRLDFDIAEPGDNQVQEFNDPPIVGDDNWHTKRYEVRRPRDATHQRKWRVRHEDRGRGYEIRPGPNDGDADAGYGIGDLWVLRYHPDEIDDGVALYERDPAKSMEHIERFMNGEAVDEEDVVIWYAGHFRHDVAHQAGELLGPDLVPFGWR